MSNIVISIDNLSKSYRLGQIGTGTLTNDLKVWWARVCGKPNPLLKIGQQDYGNQDGETVWALKDVSFQVEQGEVMGIIGRNGAGKSTLLKILSRVTAPTSGQVKVKGRIASLLEVGTGFHPELTGRENIYLNGAILGMSKEEVRRKFDEIVAFSEVEKFIDTPVKRYSSGMYVRLAFAVAAHLESEILLVDEVLAVGDAEFQKKCLGKMGDVASKEGRTVLFVSHNMGAVGQLCGQCVMLKNGNVGLSGESSTVVSGYLTGLIDEKQNHINMSIDKPKINEIRLFQNGIDTKNIHSIENFELHISCSTVGSPLERNCIGVVFKSITGLKLFSVNSDQYGIYAKPEQQNVIFSIYLQNLPFAPGTYSVSFYLGDRVEALDNVENAIYFDVVWKTNEDVKYPPRENWGPIFIPVRWQVQ